jgi:hypothetical protein
MQFLGGGVHLLSSDETVYLVLDNRRSHVAKINCSPYLYRDMDRVEDVVCAIRYSTSIMWHGVDMKPPSTYQYYKAKEIQFPKMDILIW